MPWRLLLHLTNEAARRLLELDAGDAREKAAGSIANLWAKELLRRQWSGMTLEGDDRDRNGRALGGWASTEPAEAAAFINDIPAEERTDSQIREVGRRWSEQEPSRLQSG